MSRYNDSNEGNLTQDLMYSTENSLQEQSIESMVQVNYNGSTFFVPESLVYNYPADNSASDALLDSSSQTNTSTFSSYNPVTSSSKPRVTANESMETMSADLIANEQDWATWNQVTSFPAPPKRCLQLVGLPENLHDYFATLDFEASKQMEPDDERYKEIPSRFHSAYLLDDPSVVHGTYGSFGYPTRLYKVIDSYDSHIYVIRRVDNLRINQTIIKNASAKWLQSATATSHPSIVKLYSIHQDKGAIFFTYAYHASAQTLKQRFIDERGPLINESLVWRILSQLVGAIRHVHNNRLATRVINPVHVLLTSGTVVRINNVAIPDITEFESRKSLVELQRDDYLKLGFLILSIVSRAIITAKNAEHATLILQQHFSSRLNRVVRLLLTADVANNSSIQSVVLSPLLEIMSESLMDELDANLTANDGLHSYLHQEYENGRILRLLIKLGLVNERPDPSSANNASSGAEWSEIGDRYILKLFRDYVFHQNIDGKPFLDFGHILHTMNKLDAGSDEQIILFSRDNKDLIVVSFNDIRRCLDNAVNDLVQQQGFVSSSADQHSRSMEATTVSRYNIPSKNSTARSTAPVNASGGDGVNLGSQPTSSKPFTPSVNASRAQTIVKSSHNIGGEDSIDSLSSHHYGTNLGLKPTASEWKPLSASSVATSPRLDTSRDNSGYTDTRDSTYGASGHYNRNKQLSYGGTATNRFGSTSPALTVTNSSGNSSNSTHSPVSPYYSSSTNIYSSSYSTQGHQSPTRGSNRVVANANPYVSSPDRQGMTSSTSVVSPSLQTSSQYTHTSYKSTTTGDQNYIPVAAASSSSTAAGTGTGYNARGQYQQWPGGGPHFNSTVSTSVNSMNNSNSRSNGSNNSTFHNW